MLRRALEASMMESTATVSSTTTATEGDEEGNKTNEGEGKKDENNSDSA